MNSSSTSPSKARPRRSWSRILLAPFLVLVAALLATEVCCRLWFRLAGAPYDPDEARTAVALAASRAVDFVPRVRVDVPTNPVKDPAQATVLHPYLGFVVAAKLGQLEAERERIGAAEHDGDFEILIVGGSVADIFGHLGEPRLLDLLRADPRFANRGLYAYKYGAGGYKQPQLVNLVNYLLMLGFTPECVVNIDGFNDVALSLANSTMGTNPMFPSGVHWGSLTAGGAPDRESLLIAARGVEAQQSIAKLANRALEWGLCDSAALGTIVQGRLTTLGARAQASYDGYAERMAARSGDLVRMGPKFSTDPRAAVEVGVKAWEEGSRSLRALCEARKIQYLHVLQPTLHDEGSKPLTPGERANGVMSPPWIEGVHIGYPLLRAAGERLKREGEHFFDATRIFESVSERLYFDGCHFNPEGNRILAERTAAALLEALPAGK